MIRAIIIDDELRGREVLHKMLQKFCSSVDVVALADSAATGKKLIKEHSPDLVFLDIEMPYQNGFEMLESMDAIDFNVVFVSAHAHHAMKAIKYSALDYLLKPVNINELQAAVDKAGRSFQSKGVFS